MNLNVTSVELLNVALEANMEEAAKSPVRVYLLMEDSQLTRF
jgi:hypothetical protein